MATKSLERTNNPLIIVAVRITQCGCRNSGYTISNSMTRPAPPAVPPPTSALVKLKNP